MNILGTGLSGMIGVRITSLLTSSFQFENLSLETGVDITDKISVEKYVASSDAPWVWHFAAVTDVDGSEKERNVGEKSNTWKVNVQATETIVNACKKLGKRLLYLSTDYVFDGTKEEYVEEDTPNPQSWYAISKYEGEKRVLSLGDMGLVARIANPYKGQVEGKPDFVHSIKERLASGQQVMSPTDQLFVPTFIDDIASALEKLTLANAYGIYHVVGSQGLSPYQASSSIANCYGYSTNLVVAARFKDYFQGRAPRPFHAVLNNAKITKLGLRMKTFDEGLNEVKKQESG